jgi:hypothetical protein
MIYPVNAEAGKSWADNRTVRTCSYLELVGAGDVGLVYISSFYL